MVIEQITCFIVCDSNYQKKCRQYVCLYLHGDSPIVYFYCQHTLWWSVSWLGMYINRLTPNQTQVSVEKMPIFCEVTYHIYQKLKWSLNYVLSGRLCLSSKRTCLLSLYIILPSFINIGQELFDIIEIKTHPYTHRQTHTCG